LIAPRSHFALDRGRIRLADAVLVYLERTLAGSAPFRPGVGPPSYGLAPTAVSGSGVVLAPVGSGEAVWLGFQAIDSARPATLRVRAEGPPPLDAVTGEPWEEALTQAPRNHLVCPPDYFLAGLRRPAGHVPFGEGELTVLAYGARPEQVAVHLVAPDTFARLTGAMPEPIDPDSAYKGWRLP
jgi:hypothetical protein